MIYLDTNVLIAYINPKDRLHNKALSLISKFNRKKTVISQLVLLELYSVFSRVMNISNIELEALVNYTLRKCNVEVVFVEWNELYNCSLNHANKLKLRTLDLLHVIATYLTGARAIVSFDKDISSKSNIIKRLFEIEVIGF